MAILFWLCVIAIVYTYAGYPLLLALFSRLFSKQSNYVPSTPTITLLIAAYNEERVIAEKLENSLALDYPPERLQILVAADGSDDTTCAVVREYASRGVELSFRPVRQGKMAAINSAMPHAQGEIVVFSDANNSYEHNALQELIVPFSDTTIGAVTGAKRTLSGDGMLGESDGLYWKYESFIKRQETKLGSTTGVSGEILAIRRSLFERPPDHIINDDFYMVLQILRRGYRVVYAPKAISYERISVSAQDEITRRARIVAGRYQAIMLTPRLLSLRQPRIAWQVISHKFLRPLVPIAMVGALVANLIAVTQPDDTYGRFISLNAPWGQILLALQASFYILAMVGSRIEKNRRAKLPFYIYLPTFLVNSNFAALIGLYHFLMGRQNNLWQRVRRI